MIDLIGVSKSYKVNGIRKVIFDGLSFSFPNDRNVAILGPNGAGKSTLIRLIAGTELPDRGRIVRRGRVSWPLGFSSGFNGGMTGLENIRFVARIYRQDTEQMIDYVSDFSELGTALHLPVKTYSSGMKARLAIGMSLAIDFDCYLIDEIIAVGDERFKAKSKAAIDAKISHARVIMVSHSISQIMQYCDCGIMIRDGQIDYYDDILTLRTRFADA
ncbi:ABC transporter ATP-binding protein [Ochrobactrum sp. RH2CCR150]|uniref:ABC transporter ATP-binding protein n=1 Tax=Ochrobactrum sp. RH2CCR150 TaxID=2587044 RepID=UPI0015F8AE76|nr:capsular polysaccharide transport system ATP-binding protein [Ochrobactrum sp. RH2CCR150]